MPTYEYPRPALTVDAVVLRGSPGSREVLLVQRAQEPFLGMWALPGGFVDEMEPPLAAARRELAEETGVELDGPFYQVGVFGEPGRDPRGWVVSGAFVAALPDPAPEASAGSDASDVGWHPVNALPPLAADHGRIIAESVRRLERELEPWTHLTAP
ncbi:MAG: NUDIX hydrolase [Coriobacteriia bacterium]|nr:NUDIX hydrolase [Coriobacteriia bacterium]